MLWLRIRLSLPLETLRNEKLLALHSWRTYFLVFQVQSLPLNIKMNAWRFKR